MRLEPINPKNQAAENQEMLTRIQAKRLAASAELLQRLPPRPERVAPLGPPKPGHLRLQFAKVSFTVVRLFKTLGWSGAWRLAVLILLGIIAYYLMGFGDEPKVYIR